MADNIRIVLNEIEEDLRDRVLTRQEKRDFKSLLANHKLDSHQRQVVLASVRDLLLNEKLDCTKTQAVEWLYEYSKLLKPETNKASEHEVCFSPGTACRELICSSIRFAEKRIWVCVFTISDDKVTEELLNAHRIKKDVRIITDNDKTEDRGSDIDRMEAAGIPVVTDNTSAHMHHKFALFDDDKVLTGSYNWTRSAALYNHENIVELNDPKIYQAFEKEFKDLWKELG
jgi:cardiolipin hydrolase